MVWFIKNPFPIYEVLQDTGIKASFDISCQRCSDDRCGLCLAQETSEKPGSEI